MYIIQSILNAKIFRNYFEYNYILSDKQDQITNQLDNSFHNMKLMAVLATLSILGTYTTLHGQDNNTTASTGHLSVIINDIKAPTEGTLYVMLHKTEDSFPADIEKVFRVFEIKLNGESSIIAKFDALTFGSYGISALLDKNDNGKLDLRFGMIPKEPIAVFNLEKMKRPKYKDAIYLFSNVEDEVTLKLLNQ